MISRVRGIERIQRDILDKACNKREIMGLAYVCDGEYMHVYVSSVAGVGDGGHSRRIST